ncbi:7250_t:CDS:2, partial [Dentiscutata heterogama]
NELKILINIIEETQSKNSYVKYGRYIEDCAKNLGWHELLCDSVYDPLRLVEAKNQIINLQYKNVNDVVKTIAQTLPSMLLSPNNLILSEILDIPTLTSESSPIKTSLKKKKLWKLVKKPIKFLLLPDNVEQFVIKVWKNSEYQTCRPNINESTWGHNVIKPIIDFIEYDLETEILIRWDAITSQASLDRNGDKGPIKKYDIFDETLIHSIEDRIKLGKGAKDSLDSILRTYSKSPNFNLTNLKIFLLYSHGTKLEFLIFDKKYSPMFRIRRLAIIEIPFKKGSHLLELIKVVHTFKSLIEETVVNIKFFKKAKKYTNYVINDDDKDEEDEDDEGSENYESEDNGSNDERREDYEDNESKEDKENEHEELENETIK